MSGKHRNIRKKRALDEQEELPDEQEAEGEGGQPQLTAEDIRLLQKQRQRHGGVEASTLAVADTRAAVSKGKVSLAGPVQQDGLQAAFKRERRLHSEEEDPHMKQYIEEQLAKRMGRDSAADEAAAEEEEAERQARARDPLLAALPEGIGRRQQDTELGPSWVAGITEVPLSMEQKLANIEATEAAKKRMLAVVPGDGDDEGLGAAGVAARRGQFPVSFGRQNPKHLKVIQETQAKKAVQRVRQEEKKRKKKEEFAGW